MAVLIILEYKGIGVLRGIKTDLKTKKTVMPMTTPRPAIPREKVIQQDDRDSGILTLEFIKK